MVAESGVGMAQNKQGTDAKGSIKLRRLSLKMRGKFAKISPNPTQGGGGSKKDKKLKLNAPKRRQDDKKDRTSARTRKCESLKLLWQKVWRFCRQHRRDCIYLAILVGSFLLFEGILTQWGEYVMGTNGDFTSQHIVFPEYFRLLFYENHDLLPDFAYNIGAGQNIYNFSYYGLLSPIILISYLLPQVPMLTYIVVAMQIVVISSVLLFYLFLRKHHYPAGIAFICSFLFLFSAPLIAHSHWQIMLIDYFPFLILSLFGVDRFLAKRKSGLMIISITLMIFTSYYFSIAGLVVIILYSIYQCLKTRQKIWGICWRLGLRALVALLASAVLTVPTLAAILASHRADFSLSVLNLGDLLLPTQYASAEIFFLPHSIGLGIIWLITAIYQIIFSHQRVNIVFSIMIIIITAFPIFCYLFNGGLYAFPKVLIPLIPLVLINVADCLQIWQVKTCHIRPRTVWWHISITSVIAIICGMQLYIGVLSNGNMLLNSEWKQDEASLRNGYANILDIASQEDINYRTADDVQGDNYINRITDIDLAKTTIYSSVYNNNLIEFVNNTLHSSLLGALYVLYPSNNILSQMYFGEKYYLSEDEQASPYRPIADTSAGTIYTNDYVLPVGYATHETISQGDFASLDYPDNVVNLLGKVITDKTTSDEFLHAQMIQPEYMVKEVENLTYERNEKGEYVFTPNEPDNRHSTIWLQLKGDYTNKIMIAQFDFLGRCRCDSFNDGKRGWSIEINNNANALNCDNSMYENRNYHPVYTVLIPKDNLLKIQLNPVRHEINNITLKIFNLAQLEDIASTVNPFYFEVKGDTIAGDINVTQNNSYFAMSIPYDNGFTALVDGEPVEVELTNTAFIGFPITKGKHNIEIIYEAPYKRIGIALSGIGVIMFVGVMLSERRLRRLFAQTVFV